MTRYYWIWSVLFLCCGTDASAQAIGLGASVNYQMNGIHVFYATPLNKRWDFEGGIRVGVNTFAWNENKNDALFYQTGYAMHFPEHLALNLRLSRKLATYKILRLDGMANMLFSRNSVLGKFHNIPMPDDSTGWYLKDVVQYFDAAFAAEFTIGLKLKIMAGKNLDIIAASGIGIVYMDYSHQSLLQPDNQVHHNYGEGWNHEFVGLDGMPMMFIGASYKLGGIPWLKKKQR